MVTSKSQALQKLLLVVGLLFFLLVSLNAHSQTIQHNMNVELIPGLKSIKVVDTLRFPKDTPRKISFLLHKDLSVAVLSADDTLTVLHAASGDETFTEYGLTLGEGNEIATLAYGGVISGLISNEGAALFGETYWYPKFLGQMISFDATVKAPSSWRALMQGQVAKLEAGPDFTITRYNEIYPQQDMYLIAAAFKIYSLTANDGKLYQVFLRKDDSALAQSYLSLIPEYIRHYSEILGAYPYSSFSVVENMWESGYGMPGFTLLGPSVIRLPFILTTSLPHEILHNWWGNSVYVNYESGNWSEGLTTYMADYWQAEKSGTAREYRMNVLMNYSDFVATNPDKDFALKDFRGRHSSSTQAVGYGKTMMLFTMLEHKFGKALVDKSLSHFYSSHQFQQASFVDIQTSFEKVTGHDLSGFFAQWVNRTGAPEIALSDARVMGWTDGRYNVAFELRQLQTPVYDLDVPVVLTFENSQEIRLKIKLNSSRQPTVLMTSQRPLKISVDPDFLVFRKLYSEERPATLSQIFGSPLVHFYSERGHKGAEGFIKVWSGKIEGRTTSQYIEDGAPLSDEGALVFVGDAPAFAEFVRAQLQDQKFELTNQTITIQDQIFDLKDTSTALVMGLKGRKGQTLAWVRWSSGSDPEEWASRLTHYGTFGILAFKGRPVALKSSWPVSATPLQSEF
ncbi:M1 family aminopeptidase [Bdellovibrio sp. SKB1291214]|uniref:M1 family metallopeptidase n=1 Tax=Bdellovibrio sp. SKB1291214 TaxID=1732569 RepID=UPI000B51C630|nr:M1 family aminopeptidase [Bdellovibrio sp. SKB1291214]UYL08499.1 M1 family aminopeptidase [Bdellovibrio sp. SKB1291214]